MQFADWAPIYEKHSDIPNVGRFSEQAHALKTLLATAAPDTDQQQDLDFVLVVGHLFTLIVYGQLILEQADLIGLDPTFWIRYSTSRSATSPAHAVALHGKPSSTAEQQEWAIVGSPQAGRRPGPVGIVCGGR